YSRPSSCFEDLHRRVIDSRCQFVDHTFSYTDVQGRLTILHKCTPNQNVHDFYLQFRNSKGKSEHRADVVHNSLVCLTISAARNIGNRLALPVSGARHSPTINAGSSCSEAVPGSGVQTGGYRVQDRLARCLEAIELSLAGSDDGYETGAEVLHLAFPNLHA